MDDLSQLKDQARKLKEQIKRLEDEKKATEQAIEQFGKLFFCVSGESPVLWNFNKLNMIEVYYKHKTLMLLTPAKALLLKQYILRIG